MTLTKKMAFGVLSLLFLVFIGTYLITFYNARAYFYAQLQSNAQDTATSLGLSLSQAFNKDDKASMLTMVQALFDRGYFSSIEVRDLNDKVLIKRALKRGKSTVPSWFTKLLKTPKMSGEALVMKGWNQIGEVVVISNPDYAYNSLWDNALDLMKAYVFFALIALLSVYLFIHWLLKPLQRLKMQALAIRHHEFPVETKIPKTLELKEVTLAMNQMVIRIKKIFDDQIHEIEHLSKTAYQDPLTGLANRQFFLHQLQTVLGNEEEFVPGFVIMIALDGLYALYGANQKKEADALVIEVAEICAMHWSSCGRMSGNNFAVLVENMDMESFDQSYKEFQHQLQQIDSKDLHVQIYIGYAPYHLYQATGDLLGEVDKSLEATRKKGSVQVEVKDETMRDHIDAFMLEKAIHHHELLFYTQAVTDGKSTPEPTSDPQGAGELSQNNINNIFHKEILVRIQNTQIWTAGYFMPLAEKLELAHCIDWDVLTKASESLVASQVPLALNVSTDTLDDPFHRNIFLEKLAGLPSKVRESIHIELNESFVLKHALEAKLFLNELKKLEIKAGIDQVGRHFSSLFYLKELTINYVKLHCNLILNMQHIDRLFTLTNALGITIIATQVEKKEQWDTLQAMSIRWGQGKFLAEITELNK